MATADTESTNVESKHARDINTKRAQAGKNRKQVLA